MSYVSCNNSKECLNELIKEINDELSVACQLPFSIPKREIARIVDKAKKWFYKNYEDSLEEIYIALPKESLVNNVFNSKLKIDNQKLTKENLDSLRGVIKMPEEVFSVNAVYEINNFSGEAGGFSAGDTDLSIDKFIYNNTFGAGLASEDLMYYVINEKFIDNARQLLQQPLSYSYNRLSYKLRFRGELPKNAVVFDVYSKICDCDLFEDEVFIRYCAAVAKTQLARIIGTFDYKLPGNITVNYDIILSEGQEELSQIKENLKTEEGVDWFLTG